MYIYPLSNVVKNDCLQYHLYADDSQLYTSFKPNVINETLSDISSSISHINDWMTTNKLKMNNDKTEIILCGNKNKLKSIEIDNLNIGDEFISFSSNVRNLGVLIDENLSFDNHVSYLRKICYCDIRQISKLRPFLEEKSVIQLAVSLVLSKLDYCNCLFYSMTNYNFHKLQLVQNHTARVVLKAHKRSSATELLRKLHWLPVKQRVDYKIALIVFKCLNIPTYPTYLKELIFVYSPSRMLRSTDKCLLKKPVMQLKTFGERSFYYAAPEVWNNLPFELRSCSNLNIFKKKLKTFFFRIAFS